MRAPWGLCLREGPGLADRKVLILRNGETVYPAGGPVWREGISWTFVIAYRAGYRYEGFCASPYLADGGTAPAPDPGGPRNVRVVASSLRLRAGPSLAYRVQRVVPYGTELYATGATRWGSGIEWTQIAIDGTTVWGATKYLQRI